MKPKPFWLLNHFTVPIFMRIISFGSRYVKAAQNVNGSTLSPREWRQRLARDLGRRSSVRHAVRGEAKSFGRNSIGYRWVLQRRFARAGPVLRDLLGFCAI